MAHYLNMAKVALDAFDAAITDWELYRGFERMWNRDPGVRERGLPWASAM